MATGSVVGEGSEVKTLLAEEMLEEVTFGRGTKVMASEYALDAVAEV